MIESVPLNNSPRDSGEIKKQQVKKKQNEMRDSNTCKYNANQITRSDY